jgi:hypothetical protein
MQETFVATSVPLSALGEISPKANFPMFEEQKKL